MGCTPILWGGPQSKQKVGSSNLPGCVGHEVSGAPGINGHQSVLGAYSPSNRVYPGCGLLKDISVFITLHCNSGDCDAEDDVQERAEIEPAHAKAPFDRHELADDPAHR